MSKDIKWLLLKDSRVYGPKTTSQIVTGLVEGQYDQSFKVRLNINSIKEKVLAEDIDNYEYNNWKPIIEVPEFTFFCKKTFGISQDEHSDPTTQDFSEDTEDTLKKGPEISEGYYRVSKKSESFKSIVQYTFITIAILFLGSVLLSKINKVSDKNGEWFARAVEQKSIGDYSNALISLEKAYEKQPSNVNVALDYVELLIEKGFLNLAKSSLDKVATQDKKMLARKYNLLGLVELKVKNLDIAQKHFQDSMEIDPDYTPSLINSGVTHFLKNQYFESDTKLELAYKKGERDSVLLLSQFFNIVELFTESQNPEILNQINERLRDALKSTTGFEIHFHLALTFLEILSENFENANKIFINILFLDPDLDESKFLTKLDIFRDHLNWDSVFLLVQKFFKLLNNNPENEAVRGVIELKMSNYEKADSYISNAILRDRENASIRVLYAYLKMKLGLLPEAYANIELIRDSNHLPLTLLKGKLCELSEQDCSDLFRTIIQHDLYKLQSIEGLAKILIREEKLSEAGKLIKSGLKISSKYIPLLALEKQLHD